MIRQAALRHINYLFLLGHEIPFGEAEPGNRPMPVYTISLANLHETANRTLTFSLPLQTKSLFPFFSNFSFRSNDAKYIEISIYVCTKKVYYLFDRLQQFVYFYFYCK